jgi:hypothetical protein
LRCVVLREPVVPVFFCAVRFAAAGFFAVDGDAVFRLEVPDAVLLDRFVPAPRCAEAVDPRAALLDSARTESGTAARSRKRSKFAPASRKSCWTLCEMRCSDALHDTHNPRHKAAASL